MSEKDLLNIVLTFEDENIRKEKKLVLQAMECMNWNSENGTNCIENSARESECRFVNMFFTGTDSIMSGNCAWDSMDVFSLLYYIFGDIKVEYNKDEQNSAVDYYYTDEERWDPVAKKLTVKMCDMCFGEGTVFGKSYHGDDMEKVGDRERITDISDFLKMPVSGKLVEKLLEKSREKGFEDLTQKVENKLAASVQDNNLGVGYVGELSSSFRLFVSVSNVELWKKIATNTKECKGLFLRNFGKTQKEYFDNINSYDVIMEGVCTFGEFSALIDCVRDKIKVSNCIWISDYMMPLSVKDDIYYNICGRSNNDVEVCIEENAAPIDDIEAWFKSYRLKKVLNEAAYLNMAKFPSNTFDFARTKSDKFKPMFTAETATSELVIPDGTKEITQSAYKNNKVLEKLVIPEGVKKIGKEAFYGCINLRYVKLPESLTKIDAEAFYKCESIKTIDIPAKVKSIGKKAFFGCKKLKRVTLNEGLTKIDEKAFWKCIELNNVVVPESVTTVGDAVFLNCDELKDLKVPKHLKQFFK